MVTQEMHILLVPKLKVCYTISALYYYRFTKPNWKIISGPPVSDVQDHCNPSPCGQNSYCNSINNQAICSCLPGYFGSPPACRRECAINSDCVNTKACVNERCIDPCPGSCAYNAECSVINHKAICYCMPHYTGDPFVRCIPMAIGKINHNIQLSNSKVYSFHFMFIKMNKIIFSIYSSTNIFKCIIIFIDVLLIYLLLFSTKPFSVLSRIVCKICCAQQQLKLLLIEMNRSIHAFPTHAVDIPSVCL